MAKLNYYDVLLKPIITEKSMDMMVDRKYTFTVHPEATKIQVKEAVQKMFPGTKVLKVNTLNQQGKNKRRGATSGQTAKIKKAVVTLTPESKEIDFFEGM